MNELDPITTFIELAGVRTDEDRQPEASELLRRRELHQYVVAGQKLPRTTTDITCLQKWANGHVRTHETSLLEGLSGVTHCAECPADTGDSCAGDWESHVADEWQPTLTAAPMTSSELIGVVRSVIDEMVDELSGEPCELGEKVLAVALDHLTAKAAEYKES